MKIILGILFGIMAGGIAGVITFAILEKQTPKSSSEGARVSLTMDDVLLIYENGWVRGNKSGLINRDTWAQDSAFITETLWGSFHKDGKVFLNNKRIQK